MAAYLIAEVDVKDSALYDQYRKGVLATVERYGGRFLVRGGATVPLEGAAPAGRFVVIEFPSMDKLRAWYDSPEYVPLRELRMRASTGCLFAADGS